MDQSRRRPGTPTLSLVPAESPRETLVARVRRSIVSEVRRGRLRPGQALPGSRPLAAALGVHRNTVLAALRELESEGWVSASPAKGTFVSEALPERRPRAEVPDAAPDRPGFDVPDDPWKSPKGGDPWKSPKGGDPWKSPKGDDPWVPSRPARALSFYGGIPDVRLVDTALLARALRRALRDPSTLRYGSPLGDLRLRRALSRLLSDTRGVPRAEDEILVTSGSQMAIDLVGRALVPRGAVVAVEALGYRPAWDALRRAGVELVPVPVDGEGLDVSALERIARKKTLAGVLLTPHHQCPTTVTLSAPRRVALLELARRSRWIVLEDDYDHEFHYEGRPILPLASADPGGNVVYVGTLSKVLSPGLRVGYVAAPRSVVARLAALRASTDREGNHVVERAVAELLEDGEAERHVRRARKVYHARRDALVGLLATTFGESLSFRVPGGGTSIHATVGGDVDVEAVVDRAYELGLSLQSPRTFAFDGRTKPFLRLGFAQHDEAELAKAVAILARVLPRAKRRRPRAGPSPDRAAAP